MRASLTRNWRNAMVVAQPSGVDRFNSGAYGLEIRPESRHPLSPTPFGITDYRTATAATWQHVAHVCARHSHTGQFAFP